MSDTHSGNIIQFPGQQPRDAPQVDMMEPKQAGLVSRKVSQVTIFKVYGKLQ